ncbi:germ cell-specific gene 1-like protein [Stegostoma tigrinum]|uniref:germ cell-specific gene 1-like protein n=1 Tax=Stegostoma tigrinum TaxID=3053191 RepID=UPI00202B476F|nr:germ cell-specific gene 1-like protein [Stegostoma tigrinum]
MGCLCIKRDTVSAVLNALAVGLSAVALSSTYWCVGTQRVPKPTCTNLRVTGCTLPLDVEMDFNSSTRHTQYNWEMGDDRFIFRSFHTGIWISCEENITGTGERCRSFIDLAPVTQQGILWLSLVSEVLHVGLLSFSFLLMGLHFCLSCNPTCGLKLNAFAAIFSVLSGLLGMVAHMMYSQVFHVAASQGPEDWRPHHWVFGWSFYFAWASFTFCMASSVTALNGYTKTVLEFNQSQKIYRQRLERGLDSLPRQPCSTDQTSPDPALGLLSCRPSANELNTRSLGDECC